MQYRRSLPLLLIAALAAGLTVAGTASAQGPRGGGADGGWGPGSMMGPGMMSGRGLGFMCSPRAAGMAEWRMDRIEAAIKPTEPQKALIKDLREASTKAAEGMRAACAGDVPTSPAERMAAMEKRLEAALTASKTVRPAFEKLYASLDAEQKKKLEAAGPRRWGFERWQEWWRNRKA